MRAGSVNEANARNSATMPSEAACRTAKARMKMLTTTTARSITPRLQKLGSRIPVPV